MSIPSDRKLQISKTSKIPRETTHVFYDANNSSFEPNCKDYEPRARKKCFSTEIEIIGVVLILSFEWGSYTNIRPAEPACLHEI